MGGNTNSGGNSGGGAACATGTPSIGCGNGFNLGDAANYGIIAFNPHNFQGTANSPINGNVGIGQFSGNGTIQLANDTISGYVTFAGLPTDATGGTVNGGIVGFSSQLSCDISALGSMSQQLASECGTQITPTNGETINACSGKLDCAGNEVFTLSQWANGLTIEGSANQHVVLNVGNNSNFNLDDLNLCGGITANNVLINYTGTQELHGTNGDVFNGTVLAPDAKVNVDGVTLNGHLYGGAAGQDFQWVSNAVLNMPPPCGCASSPYVS